MRAIRRTLSSLRARFRLLVRFFMMCHVRTTTIVSLCNTLIALIMGFPRRTLASDGFFFLYFFL